LTREAVEDTGKATGAMLRQNELTERSQRPWITITDVSFKVSGMRTHGGIFVSIVVDIQVKNVGTMPAINVSDYCTPITLNDKLTTVAQGIYAFNREPRGFNGRNVAPNETTNFVHTTGVKIDIGDDPSIALPIIYVPISFIYNAWQQRPPFETSLTYWIGKVSQGRGMRPFSLKEILDAPSFDGDRLGGIKAEYHIVETGHMV
jgi:hypothetical protein